MGPREQRINDILNHSLAPTHMELENESHKHSVPANSETHFKILVVSTAFAGKSRIDRQRMVNELLKAELQSGLHALTQRTLTPEEWSAAAQKFESPDCLGGSQVKGK